MTLALQCGMDTHTIQCSVLYMSDMRAETGPGRSHPVAGRRVAVTPGGVGVMTDGQAVMVGARGGSPQGSAGPVLSSDWPAACVIDVPAPGGGEEGAGGGDRGWGGVRGGVDVRCGKWMHTGDLPFCHQTMGL